MTSTPSLPSRLQPPGAYDAASAVAALSDTLRHTVAMAVGFVGAGRRIDLTGLDHGVGLLCAKALDLQPAQGRAARIGLIELLAEIGALSVALRSEGPP